MTTRFHIFTLSLLLFMLALLSGCNQSSTGLHKDLAGGVQMPVGILGLPATGTLSVNVFMDAATTPWHSETNVDPNASAVTLQFTAPEGTHTFTIVFDYDDPQFPTQDGGPWELARWTSDPLVVAAGDSLALNVSQYTYEDLDNDGISNAAELIARTNPGDVNDPPPTPPPPPPPPPPAIVPPDGLWRGATTDLAVTDLIAILRGDRIIMTGGNLIYDGAYNVGNDGAFTGTVDVYRSDGDKLTAAGQIGIAGTRLSDTELTLNVDAVGDSVPAQTMNFAFDTLYDRDSDLALTARMWGLVTDHPKYTLTFPVDSNGTLTGAADTEGCLYSGNLGLLDTQYNVYSVAISVDRQRRKDCRSFVGKGYSGYASLTPDDNTLRLIVSNASHAFSFELTPQ